MLAALTEHDLPSLVRSQDLDGLQDAWQEALGAPGDVKQYCQVVTELCAADSLSLALALASPMVDALAEKDRRADAISLANTVIQRSAHNENLARRLFDLLEQESSSEEWYALALSLSKLSSSNLTPEAFKAFNNVSSYTVGNVLYHRAGWNEGVVEALDCANEELTIRFASGRSQEFPLKSALDSLRPLAKDDLRAMRILAPEELERLSQEEPAALVRLAAILYRGSITSTQVKKELSPSVIPTKKWATYWKKAKTAAANDPWLQISGSSTRPTFTMRKKPLSLADEAARSMRHASHLGEAIAQCREFIGRNTDEAARQTILDLAKEQVETALGKDDESHAHILDGILLLNEFNQQTSVSAAEELKAMLSDEEGNFHPEAFDELATQEAREHAVELLPAALGETWHEITIANLTRFPSSVTESAVNALQKGKHGHGMLSLWPQIAPYPRRHPILTYLLGRLYTEGTFDDLENKPDTLQVGRVMMHLARIIAGSKKSDTLMQKIRSRLISLLVGRKNLLGAALEDISRDDLAAYLGIAERAGDDFPQEVLDAILRVVAREYPDITAKPEKPFWELDDKIFVTSKGLELQKEEYRVLVEDKIPANSKAIGAAASLGDLSENSEWESAMEEQRNLTGRATIMDTELKSARLIEDQEIPGGTVAPGTQIRVTFLSDDEESNAEKTETVDYRVLGPWDCTDGDETTINYRAPLAKAFLGLRASEEGSMTRPDGAEAHFRIDDVKKII